MAGRRPNIEAEEVPRPSCSACGEPAHHRVEIVVQELVLERDAGMRARPYWAPSYRGGPNTSIATIMCAACLRRHVTVSVAATAVVEKRKGES